MPQPPHQRRRRTIPPRAPSRARPTWDQAVEAFLAEARRKNLTPATIEHYRSYLCGMRARAFVRDYRITTVDQVTPEVLRDFEAELFATGLSAGSVRLYHKVLLNFAGFCRREGWAVTDGVLSMRGPKVPQHEPRPFTPEEEQRLLEAARCERDRFLIDFRIRDRALWVQVRDGIHYPFLRAPLHPGYQDEVFNRSTASNSSAVPDWFGLPCCFRG